MCGGVDCCGEMDQRAAFDTPSAGTQHTNHQASMKNLPPSPWFSDVNSTCPVFMWDTKTQMSLEYKLASTLNGSSLVLPSIS